MPLLFLRSYWVSPSQHGSYILEHPFILRSFTIDLDFVTIDQLAIWTVDEVPKKLADNGLLLFLKSGPLLFKEETPSQHLRVGLLHQV